MSSHRGRRFSRHTTHLALPAVCAIKYGLIAVGIAIAIISMVKGVGTSLTGAFSKVNANLK